MPELIRLRVVSLPATASWINSEANSISETSRPSTVWLINNETRSSPPAPLRSVASWKP